MAKIDYPVEMAAVSESFLSCWPKRTRGGEPCQIIVQTDVREFTLEPGNCLDFSDRWTDGQWANTLDERAVDAQTRLLNELPVLTVKDRTLVEVRPDE